jgi:putative membrane protein
MTSIARNIEINIKELLGEKEFPEPLKNSGFYIM